MDGSVACDGEGEGSLDAGISPLTLLGFEAGSYGLARFFVPVVFDGVSFLRFDGARLSIGEST